MPGIYREKECPTCGNLHRKRGPFCSRSCGNSREHSEEHKQHLSKKQTEWLMSGNDESELQKYRLNTAEEYDPILPGKPDPLGNNQFISGGDIWTLDE